MLGISDNGFVSQYWYDASGERTVKESFDNEGVYVNGALSGARTGTSKFTAYISPYMVVSQGGNYTKHVYMGSQRITSKVSNSRIFGTSPVNTTDLQAKLSQQTTKIKERFDSLGVQYSGLQQTGGLVSASPAITADSYFYHPDHLGSSSLITSGSGDLVQHIQYVPFGEVFVEERNATWSTPYKFNGKEQDEETGLCYYGARYYDPRTGVWLSVDPLAEKYPNISSYVYCVNNPVIYKDPDGRDWILSTGNKIYWYGGKYGDKSNIINTYKATSGMNKAIQTATYANGQKVKSEINVQNSKYQKYKNVGPTPEGKYKINLKPSPERVAEANLKTGDLLRNPDGGIEKIPNSVEIPDRSGYAWSYQDWGNFRAKLDPVNVTGATSEDRDLNSFYFHDSEKGYSHGCTEVEGAFFEQLINYRMEGNESIEVKVDYPSDNHITNGGTKKNNPENQ